jgi:NAD-dependent dihydropyrimidine dehydrogenase PreA subunit
MPWINNELCTGCAICMQNCPAEAIAMDSQTAAIDDATCIRCGICHEVCPANAVRHDKERTPQDVQANLQWVEALKNHPYYQNDPEKQAGLLNRLNNHFNRQIEVARQTLNSLGITLNADTQR